MEEYDLNIVPRLNGWPGGRRTLVLFVRCATLRLCVSVVQKKLRNDIQVKVSDPASVTGEPQRC